MKKLTRIVTFLVIGCLFATGALAETYRFDDGVPTFTALDYTTGATLSVTAEKLVLLGIAEDGSVLAYANNTLFYVSMDELSRISSKLEDADLMPLADIEEIQRGSASSRVEAVQTALTQLGYLDSSVDGSYGNRTSAAVSAFQADHGLEETGIADAITQRLLLSLADWEIVVQLKSGAPSEFAAIADRTDANLEPLQGKGLAFEYDDISGAGFIGNGSFVNIVQGLGTSDIDSYSFTLRFGFVVAEGSESVTVTPAIDITNTSVRRPIMQSVLLKSGDKRVTIKVTGVTSAVDGSKSVETGTVKLTDEATELLRDCRENGDLKIRIKGKYESYDVTVAKDKLAGIAELGGLAVEMRAEG